LAAGKFDAVVNLLKSNGVTVITFNDCPLPAKPDAIFPNNWFSTHSNGTVIIYPMMAPSRRLEQRMDIIKYLEDVHSTYVEKVVDLKFKENEGLFLEGTGSIVFDHLYKRAYACISSRTDPNLLNVVCKHLGYEAVVFEAFDENSKLIYHTNVMMWIGTTVAAICAEAIRDSKTKMAVTKELRSTGRQLLYLSHDEIKGFAGNCLELRTRHEELILAISDTAVKSMKTSNLMALKGHLRLVVANVPTIEKVGGGGIRCMLAGIHLGN